MLQKIKANIIDFITVVRDREEKQVKMIQFSKSQFWSDKWSKAARCVNLCNLIQSLSNLSWGPCQCYNKICTLSQYFLTSSAYQTSSNFHHLITFWKFRCFFFFFLSKMSKTLWWQNLLPSEMRLSLKCLYFCSVVTNYLVFFANTDYKYH